MRILNGNQGIQRKKPKRNINKTKTTFKHNFWPGMWEGQRCFIIGGGPSLKKFNWNKLKGEITIGVNLAFDFCDPTIIFSMDNRFFLWLQQGRYGAEAKAKFDTYTAGHKVWLDNRDRVFPNSIITINSAGNGLWSDNLENGIGTGGNSGFCAIQIAYLLGANPIYLLGFDGGTGNGIQEWFHKGHPDKQHVSVYGRFSKEFNRAIEGCKKNNVELINLNPESMYPFDKSTWEDEIEKIKRPHIIAYGTEGHYAEQLAEMKKSVVKFGFQTHMKIISDRSWDEATHYKPTFIKEAMEKCKSDVVYVDADARFKRYPELFKDFKHDIGVHWRKKDNHGNPKKPELLSGTIYFKNKKNVRDLIDVWIEECRTNPTEWDQRILQRLIEKCQKNKKIDVLDIPPEYTAIFDGNMCSESEKVIEHLQLSRQNRRK